MKDKKECELKLTNPEYYYSKFLKVQRELIEHNKKALQLRIDFSNMYSEDEVAKANSGLEYLNNEYKEPTLEQYIGVVELRLMDLRGELIRPKVEILVDRLASC